MGTTRAKVTAGAIAKPSPPPIEKMLMPVVRRSPLARFALRAASGWKAATPRPLRPNAASTIAYCVACAPNARAAPASKMLAGNSQAIARRSASWPKSGCTTDEVALIANTRPAADALEK